PKWLLLHICALSRLICGISCLLNEIGTVQLLCTNDFVNNVRCTWNRSSVGPDVDCWIFGEKKGIKPKSKIQPEIIIVKCNDTLVENLENYTPHNHIKMHPPGVLNISSNGSDTLISWRPGCPVSRFFTSFDFQVQIKQNNQSWREARTLSTQEQELRIPAWQLIGHWQVRARVKPTKRNNSHWSNWSPTTSWVGATGRVDTSDNQGSPAFLVSKWLNPLSVSEPFFTAEPCDHISSVEVCEDWDVPSASPSSGFISSLVYFQSYPAPNTDTIGVIDNSSSSSSFSNMGYFMSSSSSLLARADPMSPYQDNYHNPNNSNNLKPKSSLCPSHTTCPAYESLKSEPQSPDSGFGIRKGDEKEDEKDMGIDGEQVLDDCNSHFLILPLHLPSQTCSPSLSPVCFHPASVAQIFSDSQQVDACVMTAGITSGQLMTGAICRSASMPMEPSKSGYLTLKELQTTFSNKSI
uniref:Fibronectin type-III domain-containing protein n=1 Tax=Acanthochromis polyacanthus TaxID=80966 RepID=A0A3Q1EMV9_9TELE